MFACVRVCVCVHLFMGLCEQCVCLCLKCVCLCACALCMSCSSVSVQVQRRHRCHVVWLTNCREPCVGGVCMCVCLILHTVEIEACMLRFGHIVCADQGPTDADFFGADTETGFFSSADTWSRYCFCSLNLHQLNDTMMITNVTSFNLKKEHSFNCL